MGIHMRNGINYTWSNDGIAREIETIWDTGFTPSPGVWLTYDFGVDFEDYDELIFIIGRGTETNPITEFTMHPKKIGINSLNDVDSGLAFKFDVWGGNIGWIAHDSGTTYSLGADYGGSPPKYIAIYGVKYINSSNNKYSYSTIEHKIGTWVDGRDVYRKLVPVNETWQNIGTGSNQSFVYHEDWIKDIDYVTNAVAIGTSEYSATMMKVSVQTDKGYGDATAYWYDAFGGSFTTMHVDYVILEYVKVVPSTS